MEKEEKFDWIDKYLRHELTEDELTMFNTMIARDEAFKKELALHQELQYALSDPHLENFRIAVAAADKRYVSEISTKKPVITPIYLKIAAAVALLACIFFIGLWIGKKLKPDAIALYNTHFIPYDAPVNFRSEGSTATTWNEALYHYDQGNFAEAIAMLSQEISLHPDNKLAVLLRGVSYLATGDVSAAQHDFQLIRSEQNVMFGEQATWYLALSYLKENNIHQAKTLLLELTDSRMSVKANDLLKALD